ncbi:uncharacterized protein [Clytia hemisphaerica]|uniref:uncharacterized protein n=1 Tax=Clytia hemisphaerica TaxID=252671 RepID=UPI0034D68983
MLLTMYRHDFNEAPSSGLASNDEKQTCFSQNDKKFMKMMQEESKFVDGQYVLPLPFRDRNTNVPNNRGQAVKRAIYLKKKLTANDKFFTDYQAFMKTIIDKGYAVPCQTEPNDGKTWYIPHHGVYHPRKPDKIRVVFDCSAKFKDISLNSMLLQGPDLTNQLVGVLSRFRKEPVGFFGDIEKMFYRVKVPDDQQDFLRFLWWKDGDLNSELKEYRLTVHLQGAISSPSCANFALRKTADDNSEKYDPEVTSILKESFYVDDLLKSTTTEEKAKQLLWDTKALCNDGGFNLVQLGSTSRAIIDTIPVEDRMKGIKNLDSSTSTLPIERVLGVSWCIQNDEFNFRIVLKDKPLTRRGILSSVSSIYDPLGFAAPVMLLIKRLLQKLIKDDKSWDDQISGEERAIWEKWRLQLPSLENVTIKRCFKPENFGKVVKATAHHFSDGSTIGYGQCSYLQLTDDKEQISTSFLMGKSRVAPLKQITVPRMELTAAVTSIKVSNLLNQELKYENLEHVFWTDSKVVLGYINNESKSFHVFVANRIEIIRDNSTNKQWNHVPGKINSSDIGSRGIEASKLNESRWLQGPEFLQKPYKTETEAAIYDVSPDDPEVKTKKKVLMIKGHSEQTSFINHLISQTNNWWKLKRVIARIMIWRSKQSNYTQITLDDMQAAEVTVIKLIQQNSFHKDISSLTNKEEKYTGQLSSLNPFVDDNGLLRVGGRLRKSNLNPECKNPIILPKKHALSRMIVSWYHSKVAHCGRGITMNAVRTAGYWIVNLNSLTRSIIKDCVKCRRNRGKCSTQLMADLPTERTEEVPPFTYVGVDMFGPFQVKERRSTLKKFVALFTCLNTRAVHLESSGHMDTDHFIMMLRRFIGRRGQVRLLRSDNGTNFVGCDNEMKRAINEMDDKTIEIFLQQQGGEWMGWKRNPPSSSHMGGAWERLIRSARSIFSSLIYNHGLSLNNEAFLTLLVEIEAIINSRPLTDTLSDDSELPLSPINLLTMKSRVVLPPPGNYSANDLYSRRRWRRVQHIANEFWSRWRKEYLQTLQRRSKWQHKIRNFSIGDVVLLKETNFRNDWQLARITEVFKDENNVVRSCQIRTQRGLFNRPIHKLVLLVQADRTSVESE